MGVVFDFEALSALNVLSFTNQCSPEHALLAITDHRGYSQAAGSRDTLAHTLTHAHENTPMHTLTYTTHHSGTFVSSEGEQKLGCFDPQEESIAKTQFRV